MQPIISVIIPAFKPQDYIYKNLEALHLQTLSQEQFEVIIVLNGPKEPYYNDLSAYIAAHADNVKLYYSENPGVSNARNKGIELSCGQYLTFIDDDDWVSNTYLESLLFQANTENIVTSNFTIIDDSTGEETDQYLNYLPKVYQRLKGKENPSFFAARSFLSPPVGKLIHRDIIGSCRFNTKFALGEDSLFCFEISKNIRHIRLSSEDAIYYVRIRKESASHRHYTYWFRVKLALRTSCEYFRLYLKNPTQYNIPLFISRVVATLRKLIHKAYD